MNLSHATMTDWGLKQVMVAKNAAILDVGYGGGRTVQRLATFASEGHVIGLDYSAASVAVARSTNANEIEAGRVHITRGSAAALPFPDRTFDVVTAVETHYYWPDLRAAKCRRAFAGTAESAAGTWRAESSSGNNGNALHPYGRLSHRPAPGDQDQRFRN